jgi:hypothetical protein
MKFSISWNRRLKWATTWWRAAGAPRRAGDRRTGGVARRGVHVVARPVAGAYHEGPAAVIERPRRRATRRHVILFLAADPSATSRLALDEECAAIELELRMTEGRDDFDFRSRWAVSVDDVMRSLNELQPTVIHFSGHGGDEVDDPCRPRLACRDVGAVARAGIQLQDEQRRPQLVSASALAQMIASAAPSARVVVLNACFSDGVADSLCGVVDYVVGMTGAISDDAARSFAVGFYRALGHRRSIGNAVDQAVATLAAKRFSDAHLPTLRTRDGVDIARLRLLAASP